MCFPELVGTDALTGLEEPGEREYVRKSELIGHLGDRGIGILQHALREFETLGVDGGLHGHAGGLVKLCRQIPARHPDGLRRFLHGQRTVRVAADKALNARQPGRPPPGSRQFRRKMVKQSIQQSADCAVSRFRGVSLQERAAAGQPRPRKGRCFDEQRRPGNAGHLRLKLYRVVCLAFSRVTKAMPGLRRENNRGGFFNGDHAAFAENLASALENFQLPELVLMKAEQTGFVHRAGLREQDFAA